MVGLDGPAEGWRLGAKMLSGPCRGIGCEWGGGRGMMEGG